MNTILGKYRKLLAVAKAEKCRLRENEHMINVNYNIYNAETQSWKSDRADVEPRSTT